MIPYPRVIILFLAATTAASACASAGRKAPARLVGTLPLQLTLRGSSYTGTAIIDEHLAGTFTVVGPVEVKGALKASGARDSVAFEMTYAIAANNCRGTMKLAGRYRTDDANVAEGTVNAIDSCVGPMNGTFMIGR